MEDVDEVPIHPEFLEIEAHIGAKLTVELKEKLISLLKKNHDCFTWSHEDMI